MINKTEHESIIKERREAMQREIKSHKIVIDYACFQKTPDERIDLKLAKKAYKNSIYSK